MTRFLALCTLLLSFASWASPTVMVQTNLGSFTIELNQQAAPVTVNNFLRYVNDGSYVGSQFHRVIPGFMAQGGGFDKDMNRLPTYAPIKNEATNGLANNQATIAMARTNDPNSATRQFFINFNDNSNLNATQYSAGYAVFGQVTQGFKTVQKMAQQPTTRKGRMADVPVTPIIIEKMSLLK